MDKITQELKRLSLKNEENKKYIDNIDFINKIIEEDINYMVRILLNQQYNFSFYQIQNDSQFKIIDYLNNKAILDIINYLKYGYNGYNGYQRLYDEVKKCNIIPTVDLHFEIKKIIDKYVEFLESKLETIEHY